VMVTSDVIGTNISVCINKWYIAFWRKERTNH